LVAISLEKLYEEKLQRSFEQNGAIWLSPQKGIYGESFSGPLAKNSNGTIVVTCKHGMAVPGSPRKNLGDRGIPDLRWRITS
jgi:hypothetical protein